MFVLYIATTLLSFANYEGPQLVEGFLHNLCPCFDIVFAQVGVIPKTRNNSVEIVAVAERYLVITHVQNKESKKQILSCKTSWWKNVNKKVKIFFVFNWQYCQFGKDDWKNRNCFMKISWIWTWSQIFRKFSFWENLLLFEC